MDSGLRPNTWIYRLILVLGFIFAASLLRIIVLVLRGQSLPEWLMVLGAISAAGVIQLLSSPLNRGL